MSTLYDAKQRNQRLNQQWCHLVTSHGICPEYTEFESAEDGIVNLYCDGDVDPVTGRHVDGDSRHRAATSTHPDHVFYWHR